MIKYGVSQDCKVILTLEKSNNRYIKQFYTHS